MHNMFDYLPTPKFGLIGHRGAAALAPENTLASFKKAASIGLNWIEFDVQPCASGEWVIMHDETLDRTTNGRGLVAETPYDIIKTLDAGSWFHPDYKNEKVPLLQETLDLLVDLNLHPNIELKINPPPSNIRSKHANILTASSLSGYIDSFLKVLERAWPKRLPPPLISSFDLELLKVLSQTSSQKNNPPLPIGYLVDTLTSTATDLVIKHQFQSCHCDQKSLKNQEIYYAVSQHVPLLVYTVNDKNQLHTLLEMGVSAVFSDMTINILPA